MGPPIRQGRGWCFYVAATFIALQFQHKYIHAVKASRSLQTPCILCHCTILSNILKYIQTTSVIVGLCSRLCLNLFNYSETAVSQLNGCWPDRQLSTKSKLKLRYDRRSADQSILMSSSMWGPLRDERTGLLLTTAAGPRQLSHSHVQVPRDSW
jgi:hypothetical protein